MTDEEFDSILNRVNRREQDTTPMAEGLDLALGAVGNREKATSGTIPEGRPFPLVGREGEVPSKEKEPVDPQVKAGDDRVQVEEEGTASTEAKDAGTETAEPEVEAPTPVAPQVVKPIPVKRKLVVKADPKADSPKPQRVSQRCLGKWASSRAKPNTTEDPIEIASKEERATLKKAEGELVQATDQEDTGVSPVQNEPGTTTEGMAGGPNLTSESGRPAGSEKDEALLQAEEEARLLKDSAGQTRQRQRQEALETIVTRLGDENQKLITEMGRMASVMDELLNEVTSLRKEQAVAPRGHGGRVKEPRVSEEELPETKEAEKEHEEGEAEESADSGNQQAEKEEETPVMCISSQIMHQAKFTIGLLKV
ncbi:titin-like [Salvia splendens]|uniref:titin-like n=1 Tax=Salvia splendens TaxID=180675 RepID=UPI001C25AB72|nr:titin-like [Salvia splendens]